MRFGKIFFNNCITFSSAQEISEIISPLKSLGVTYFGYHLFYHDGSQIRLNNNPEFMRYYYEEELYQHSFFGRTPYPDGSVILGSCLNNRGHIYKIMETFNIAPPLTIIETNPEFHLCIHFGGSIKKPISSEYLLARQDLLYRFIFYFRQKAHKFIEEAKKQRFKIELSAVRSENIITSPLSSEVLNTFMKETEVKRLYTDAESKDYFTLRELDIIDLLRRGKKAIQITEQFGISEKTMENHLSSIKEKLHCKTLFELGFKLGNFSWLSRSNLI